MLTERSKTTLALGTSLSKTLYSPTIARERTLLPVRPSRRLFSTSPDYPPSPTQEYMEDRPPSPSMGSAASVPIAGAKRKRGSLSKFYAVKVGYKPGIYLTWNDCLAQVTGYKGAVCMSFPVYIYIYTYILCSSIHSAIIWSPVPGIVSPLTNDAFFQFNHSLLSKKQMHSLWVLSRRLPPGRLLRQQNLHGSTLCNEDGYPVCTQIGPRRKSKYEAFRGRNTRNSPQGKRRRSSCDKGKRLHRMLRTLRPYRGHRA